MKLLCWICENDLNTSPQDPTVLDHCHYIGKILRWAHSQCNLKRRNQNYSSLSANNLTNYEIHHVVLAVKSLNEKFNFNFLWYQAQVRNLSRCKLECI